MSYVRIWIHAVWGTKAHSCFLTAGNKMLIIDHIISYAKSKKIYIDFINGDKNHLHCLLSLGSLQSIANVIHLVKGESSYWINKNIIIQQKFEWADEYFAVSVSESEVNKVRNYIKNQKEHHLKKTWKEEYNEFLKRYSFQRMDG